MDVVTAVADLDQHLDLHLSRLLILVLAFAEDDRVGAVEGLTKLAKLDFLLRYPTMLERALSAKGHSTRDMIVEDHERHSVESAMVRYRFGPWDHRYREFLNVMVAKGLATLSVEGKKVVISLTAQGRDLATSLADSTEFEQYARRAQILKKHFDLTGTNLMRFIYKTFPEILSLQSNAPISS